MGAMMKLTGKVTSSDGQEWDWAVDKVIFLSQPGHTHEVDALLQRGPGPDRPISCSLSPYDVAPSEASLATSEVSSRNGGQACGTGDDEQEGV
jgi:hypothetical protein